MAAGILGVLMIAAGVLLLLRAATSLRPELVAKLVNLDAGPHGVAQRPPQRSAQPRGDPPPTAKSFEEELAALNDQIGREHE